MWSFFLFVFCSNFGIQDVACITTSSYASLQSRTNTQNDSKSIFTCGDGTNAHALTDTHVNVSSIRAATHMCRQTHKVTFTFSDSHTSILISRAGVSVCSMLRCSEHSQRQTWLCCSWPEILFGQTLNVLRSLWPPPLYQQSNWSFLLRVHEWDTMRSLLGRPSVTCWTLSHLDSVSVFSPLFTVTLSVSCWPPHGRLPVSFTTNCTLIIRGLMDRWKRLTHWRLWI